MPRIAKTGQAGWVTREIRVGGKWRPVRKGEVTQRWRAGYRSPGDLPKHRKVVTKVFDNPGDAKDWLTTAIADMNKGKWVDPAKGKAPLGQLLDEMLADFEASGDYAPSTLNVYDTMLGRTNRENGGKEGHVPKWLRSMAVEDIEPEHIRKMVRELTAAGVGPRPIQVTRQLVARCLRRAVLDRRITVSPVHPEVGRAPRSKKRKIKPVESEVVEEIVAKIDPRYRAMVLVAAYGGLRIGECAGLRRRNIVTEKVEIPTPREITHLVIDQQIAETAGKVRVSGPKTEDSVRRLALPSWLAKELVAHVEEYVPGDDPDAYIFPAPMGGPLHRTSFGKRTWHPALKAAGVKGVRFRDLRHHGASVLIKAGVHPKIIAERLGHSDIRVTMNIYGHLMEGVDLTAADALEDARPKVAAG